MSIPRYFYKPVATPNGAWTLVDDGSADPGLAVSSVDYELYPAGTRHTVRTGEMGTAPAIQNAAIVDAGSGIAASAVTVGTSLRAVASGVSGSPAPALSYQWKLDGADIAGATAEAYVAAAAGAIIVVITARNGIGGGVEATSGVVTIGETTTFQLTSSPTTPVQSLWLGAVDSTSITLSARSDAATSVVFAVSPVADFGSGQVHSPAVAPTTYTVATQTRRHAKQRITGLQPDTLYHVGVAANGQIDSARIGAFRTLPATGSQFKIAFSGCAATGSNAQTFDRIREEGAHFFVHLGDLHYKDIKVNDEGLYFEAFDDVLGAARQNLCWRNVPMFYGRDDHDSFGNDSNGGSPARPAANAAYRKRVPHPPLALSGGPDAIYFTWKVGRVRFVMLDTRSERVAGGNMLSTAQETWLVDLMKNAPSDEVMIVCSSVAWHSSADTDTWFGFQAQRTRIANAVLAHMPGRVAMIASDMHALAYADGTTTPGRVPVYQAGPLTRTSSHKGGPYTQGPFPATAGIVSYQYATMDFREVAQGIEITYRAFSVDHGGTGTKTQRLMHTNTLKT